METQIGVPPSVYRYFSCSERTISHQDRAFSGYTLRRKLNMWNELRMYRKSRLAMVMKFLRLHLRNKTYFYR